MSRAARGAAAVALAFGSGCASLDNAADDIQVGFAAGSVLVDGRVDREPDGIADGVLEPASGIGGFVEAVVRGDTSAHFRFVGSDVDTRVRDGSASAEFRQAFLCPMLATDLALVDGLVLRPMVGFGVGYVGIEFDDSSFADEYGAAAVITAGFELEVGRSAMLGAMGWGGIGGDPGDSEVETTTLLVYAGFRL